MTDDVAKTAPKDYYDTVDAFSEAQANLACSTKVLEENMEDKTVFLDIIRQMQLPAVQVSIRTIEEEEQLKNMMYRDVTLHTHLPDFRRLNPNATKQTRTLAAFMVFCLVQANYRAPSITDGLYNRVQMPDNTIQETGNRKEAARQTRQRTNHQVDKELGRSSRDKRWYPSQESEGHTKGQTKKHPERSHRDHQAAEEAEAEAEEKQASEVKQNPQNKYVG